MINILAEKVNRLLKNLSVEEILSRWNCTLLIKWEKNTPGSGASAFGPLLSREVFFIHHPLRRHSQYTRTQIHILYTHTQTQMLSAWCKLKMPFHLYPMDVRIYSYRFSLSSLQPWMHRRTHVHSRVHLYLHPWTFLLLLFFRSLSPSLPRLTHRTLRDRRKNRTIQTHNTVHGTLGPNGKEKRKRKRAKWTNENEIETQSHTHAAHLYACNELLTLVYNSTLEPFHWQ